MLIKNIIIIIIIKFSKGNGVMAISMMEYKSNINNIFFKLLLLLQLKLEAHRTNKLVNSFKNSENERVSSPNETQYFFPQLSMAIQQGNVVSFLSTFSL